MAVFLFEIIAILLFLWLADKRKLRLLAPMVVAGAFVRYLQHLIFIDWLHFMQILGGKHMRLWLPLTAELTIWSVASYLFIQYLPRKHRIFYGICWAAVMSLYLQSLNWMKVFEFANGWTIWKSALNISLFFLLLFYLWRWLEPQAKKEEVSSP